MKPKALCKKASTSVVPRPSALAPRMVGREIISRIF
jgi:hypothetical protein